MKKSALICSLLGLIFLTTPAHADTTSTSPSTSVEATTVDAGSASTPPPQPRDAQGREIQEPREHNDREAHGFLTQSISIVVGALIIAIGLAYGIGRRNGYKQSH